MKKKELGKGIRALLNNKDVPEHKSKDNILQTMANAVSIIPLDSIEVNPYQPRKEFDEDELQALASSIKTHGLIQPITVRHLGNNKYQIISGERRFRASSLINKKEIPAYVRTADDQGMIEMALIENIQRADLNAMEIAFSYKRLIDECSLTHDELAQRVAKNRSTITNYLRLLKLPPVIQHALKAEQISMGHARSLAGVDDLANQLQLLKSCITNQWSVRQLENTIKQSHGPKVKNQAPEQSSQNDVHVNYIQDELSAAFGLKVTMKNTKSGSGQIMIRYKNLDELQQLLETVRSIPE